MKLKLKSNFGSEIVEIGDKATVYDLLNTVYSHENVRGAGLNAVVSISFGFPPKQVDMSDIKCSIAECGIRNNEQLIIKLERNEGKSNNFMSKKAQGKDKIAESEIPCTFISEEYGYLILRNIPDDNSCLFNAILYSLSGAEAIKLKDPPPSSELRCIVKDAIINQPDKFTDVILGRPVDDYCSWIIKKDSWGGAIELGILSEYFQIRISCLDIESARFIHFDPADGIAEEFIVLVYSGIHYDVLSLNRELSNKEADRAQDSSKYIRGGILEQEVLAAALKIGLALQSKNYATNTTTFRVRCLECYNILIGENGASKHANATGHFRFGEV